MKQNDSANQKNKAVVEGNKIISQKIIAERPERRGRLVVKGLSKSFGSKAVSDNFDLELELGTFTSIFGPNGCGKSTLINMISGLMQPKKPQHMAPLEDMGATTCRNQLVVLPF